MRLHYRPQLLLIGIGVLLGLNFKTRRQDVGGQVPLTRVDVQPLCVCFLVAMEYVLVEVEDYLLTIARVVIHLVAFLDLLVDLLAVVILNVNDVLVQRTTRKMTGVYQIFGWLFLTFLLLTGRNTLIKNGLLEWLC